MTDSVPRSDAPPGTSNEHAKCKACGATVRLDTGVCVSCLLREGLECDDEVSRASYQSLLAEVDAPHKSWFLGNYEILEQIGCGGMGVIYRARQRHSRRIVAVKRVLSYRADSNGALQRFRREAQAVASLDHPNILPIYEVSESEDGLPFFSMKFATKGSLGENIASLRDEPRKTVQLMAKVARAVDYAHSRGVLHRDLKPGNILLDDRGEPLVSDFGLAKLLDGSNDLTRSLTTFGTAGFIAPEQAGHAAVDFTPVADVYSLGGVFFNVLAGRPPFLGSNPVAVIRQASETQAPKLRSLVPSLDRDLETICARCLERDPNARYQSAGELAADLQRWLDGRPIVARPVSAPARMWRWSRRNPKLVGAATAGALLGAAAVWLLGGELLPVSQFKPERHIAVLPPADSTEPKNPGVGVHDESALRSVPEGFRDVTFPPGLSNTDISGPVQNSSNPFTVPDYTAQLGPVLDNVPQADPNLPSRNDRVTAPPKGTELITSARDGASGPELPTNKITAVVTAPPVVNPSTTSLRKPEMEADTRTNKITAAATPPASGRAAASVARSRSVESGVELNKTPAAGPRSFEGFVKDAKGEPINGADLRIESRDGKQLIGQVKTDPNGRYVSQGLQPGVYRVSLLVNGVVKASVANAQTKANQPTQLNFDFKPTSQSAKLTKGRKHMVWVPARTGSHLGGTWVEVEEKANEHSGSNVQTYSVDR